MQTHQSLSTNRQLIVMFSRQYLWLITTFLLAISYAVIARRGGYTLTNVAVGRGYQLCAPNARYRQVSTTGE